VRGLHTAYVRTSFRLRDKKRPRVQISSLLTFKSWPEIMRLISGQAINLQEFLVPSNKPCPIAPPRLARRYVPLLFSLIERFITKLTINTEHNLVQSYP
jgi:hypothetical protein